MDKKGRHLGEDNIEPNTGVILSFLVNTGIVLGVIKPTGKSRFGGSNIETTKKFINLKNNFMHFS